MYFSGILVKKRQSYRRSPIVEASNLSAIACPSLPPKNLIYRST